MLGWSHKIIRKRREKRPARASAGLVERPPVGSASVQRLLAVLKDDAPVEELRVD